jgi:hypothetical protein
MVVPGVSRWLVTVGREDQAHFILEDCGEMKEKRTYWLKQNSKISAAFHNLRRKLGTGLLIGRCSRGEVLGIWIRDEECSL